MHSDVVQFASNSSVHRLKRVKEMPPPKSVHDLQVILGDKKDRLYPIFRTAKAPDNAVTLATGRYTVLLMVQTLQFFRRLPCMFAVYLEAEVRTHSIA